MSSGTPLDDEDRYQWLMNLHHLIQGWHEAQQHGIFVCSALKVKYRQVLLLGPNAPYHDDNPGPMESSTGPGTSASRDAFSTGSTSKELVQHDGTATTSPVLQSAAEQEPCSRHQHGVSKESSADEGNSPSEITSTRSNLREPVSDSTSNIHSFQSQCSGTDQQHLGHQQHEQRCPQNQNAKCPQVTATGEPHPQGSAPCPQQSEHTSDLQQIQQHTPQQVLSEHIQSTLTAHPQGGKPVPGQEIPLTQQQDNHPDILFVHLRGSFEQISFHLGQRKGHFFNPRLLRSQFETLEELRGHESGIVIDIEQGVDSVVLDIVAQVMPMIS